MWFGTTYLTEFDLVHVGDDATIGTEASLQTHLFEDRVMKMSTITIADGASIGTRAIVLYDTIVGEHASLRPLSLVMKGEELPPHTSWRGIPAEAIRTADTPAADTPAHPALPAQTPNRDDSPADLHATEGVPA